MAGIATKSKVLTEKQRARIEGELRLAAEVRLALESKHAKLFAQIDGLDADLKAKATELGKSVKEEFEGRGSVGVSPRKEPLLRGNILAVDMVVWNSLSAAEQKSELKKGICKFQEDWSSANYGRVTVKLFGAAA